MGIARVGGGASSSLGIIGTRASITHGCVFTGQTHTLVAQKGRRAGLLIPMLWKEIKRGVAGGALVELQKKGRSEKNTLGVKKEKP